MAGVVILAVISAIVALYIYITVAPEQIGYARVDSTPLTEEHIGPYKIGNSIYDGKSPPTAAEPTANNEGRDVYAAGDGLYLYTTTGDYDIMDMTVRDPGHTTSKGITVGSTREDIRTAYGREYSKRSEQGADIMVYYDKSHAQALEFWLWEDKVAEVRWKTHYVFKSPPAILRYL
ncbi:hypothetical protein [Paenibacillus swuensis]|uniref:hypothetical protein n=1 Tax=Paenibacillus swuensis TaxID=1178515 RepID=UPI000838C535|nr:hypothetical protein [Paenibacillus swuensis]